MVAHESTHNTLVRAHYDKGADDETIMMSTTPTPNGSPDFWNRRNFLPCDLAAAQLEYGPASAAGKYADCFAVDAGRRREGPQLGPDRDVRRRPLTRCANTSATVTGRLALANSASYEDMRNWPLSGRVVRIDRRLAGATAWTTGVATRDRVGRGRQQLEGHGHERRPGSFEYRATWFTSAAEPAVNSSNAVTWTIRWTTIGCPT